MSKEKMMPLVELEPDSFTTQECCEAQRDADWEVYQAALVRDVVSKAEIEVVLYGYPMRQVADRLHALFQRPPLKRENMVKGAT